MLTKLVFDWKFALTLLATLAGVMVPVWLWQAELASKALTLRLISTASLTPQGDATLDGVEVSFEGAPLKNPALSIIELSNTGTRPISAADFEAPIELSATSPATIVQARLKSARPLDLAPVLSISAGKVRIAPLLLNPDDNLQLVVLTSNAPASFSTRARIAGVSHIPVSDAASAKATRRYWMRTSVAIALIAVYLCVMLQFSMLARRRVFRLGLFLVAMAAMFGGVLLSFPLSETADLSLIDMFQNIGAATILALPYTWLRLRSGAGLHY
jgi:hypothetical protein